MHREMVARSEIELAARPIGTRHVCRVSPWTRGDRRHEEDYET